MRHLRKQKTFTVVEIYGVEVGGIQTTEQANDVAATL